MQGISGHDPQDRRDDRLPLLSERRPVRAAGPGGKDRRHRDRLSHLLSRLRSPSTTTRSTTGTTTSASSAAGACGCARKSAGRASWPSPTAARRSRSARPSAAAMSRPAASSAVPASTSARRAPWPTRPPSGTASRTDTMSRPVPFCAIGCQIELAHKNGRLSKASGQPRPRGQRRAAVRQGPVLPARGDPSLRTGEAADAPERRLFPRGLLGRRPWRRSPPSSRGSKPDDFLMLVSPDLTNESLFAAQKFVREVLGSNGDRLHRHGSSSPGDRRSGRGSSRCRSRSRTSPGRTSFWPSGLDSRFNFSVVGTKVRKALDRAPSW